MDDLIAFLRARLADDEQIALADLNETWKPETDENGTTIGFAAPMQSLSTARGLHIARHDPARVLAEADAKRRTLIRCEEALLAANPMLTHFAKETLLDLTRPYADHPDYQDTWRP